MRVYIYVCMCVCVWGRVCLYGCCMCVCVRVGIIMFLYLCFRDVYVNVRARLLCMTVCATTPNNWHEMHTQTPSCCHEMHTQTPSCCHEMHAHTPSCCHGTRQVGEEDHMRIMCMKKGSIINEVFDRCVMYPCDVIGMMPSV